MEKGIIKNDAQTYNPNESTITTQSRRPTTSASSNNIYNRKSPMPDKSALANRRK